MNWKNILIITLAFILPVLLTYFYLYYNYNTKKIVSVPKSLNNEQTYSNKNYNNTYDNSKTHSQNNSDQSISNLPTKSYSDLPKYAQHTIDYLRQNNFSGPEEGYVGGREWTNYQKVLPVKSKGYYKEWDVKKKIQGVNRGKERLVTGKNGEIYYTDTHYGDAGDPAFYQVVD